MSRRRKYFWWTALISGAAILFLYLPLLAVVTSSFNSAPHGGAWRSFTLRWYTSLAQDHTALSAARVTCYLALGSTFLSTIMGTLLALGLTRSFPGKRTVETAMVVPVVVPDIVMAVALLSFFHLLREHLAWFDPGLITMTIAHVTFQIPFVALVVRARLTDFDATLEEAARDLGASRWQTFFRVKLPLIWPGILGGALLALTLSLDDFVVSFFTSGPGATTLPILIYSSVKRGLTPSINALSTLFIAAAMIATLALAALQRRRRQEHADGP